MVGWVLKATVDRGSDPAGALCEMSPKGGGGRYKIKLGICMHELVSNATDYNLLVPLTYQRRQ